MKAGLLNTRVEIQHKAKDFDESGATVYRWKPLCTVWSDIRHSSGRETIQADALVETVRASIRIRYNRNITAEMRVLLKSGEAYDIKAVLPDMQRREFMDLVCEKTGEL